MYRPKYNAHVTGCVFTNCVWWLCITSCSFGTPATRHVSTNILNPNALSNHPRCPHPAFDIPEFAFIASSGSGGGLILRLEKSSPGGMTFMMGKWRPRRTRARTTRSRSALYLQAITANSTAQHGSTRFAQQGAVVAIQTRACSVAGRKPADYSKCWLLVLAWQPAQATEQQTQHGQCHRRSCAHPS